MINVEQVAYIDVHHTYFDIDIEDFQQYEFLFDKEKGFQVTMNQVLTKPYAIEKAFQIYQPMKNEFTNLYVSMDTLRAGQIFDYQHQQIFPDIEENISGWLFFFDMVPFANWEHPCRYLFMIDETNYQEILYNRGLSEKIQIEKLY